MAPIKKRAGRVALLLVFVMLVSAFGGCADLSRKRVQWRDEAVGRAAAVSLGKKPNSVVYFDELESITSLVIESDQPVDITDLSGLPSLVSVDLRGARAADYYPLALCEKLNELYVGNVYDESSIDALEELQERVETNDIDVDLNYWSDFKAEFSDPVIEEAVRNTIQKPEGELTYADTRLVTTLEFDQDVISFPSDFTLLFRLRELTMINCGLTDASFVGDIPTLLYVDLSDNSITDISWASNLSDLQVLAIKNNQVSDISPVAGLEQLFALSVNGNPVTDLTPVSSMTSLTNLNIGSCGISNIDFLAGNTALEVLWLGENAVSDIAPLTEMTSMRVLSLTSNRVRDISALAGMTEMTHLYLADNNISDITPISGMSKLEALQLTMNNVFDITPITGLEELKELGILSNPVTDYQPLLDAGREWTDIDIVLDQAAQATATAKAIADSIAAQGLDPYNTILAVHDAVVKTTRYDYNAAESGNLGFATQSMWSALIQQSCVCVGYAESVTVILRLLGFEAYEVSGTANGAAHAWTMVYIDDVPYYIDATWDDPDTGSQVYRDYFMVTGEQLHLDHVWDEVLFQR